MAHIDLAQSNDGPSIHEITVAVGVFSPVEVSCVEELWNEYLDKSEASGYVFLVYRGEQEVVQGYTCFGPRALTQGAFDLYWIAVDPSATGRGIGHQLLARVEDEVRARGGRLVLIETSDAPAYGPARRLYESSGYRLEATIRDFYLPGEGLYIYTKLLATS